MDALLLIDHGSRRPAANEQLERVAALVRSRLPGVHVATAHMELATPTIPQAIAEVAAAGAREVVVVPYMLTPGRHAMEDIPRLVAEAALSHPPLRTTVSAPLGVHEGLAAVVVARALETTAASRR